MARRMKQLCLTRVVSKRPLVADPQDIPPAKRTKSVLRVHEVYSSSDEEVTDTGSQLEFSCPHCGKVMEAPNATIRALHISRCKQVTEEDRSLGLCPQDPSSEEEGERPVTPDTIFDDGLGLDPDLGSQDPDPDLGSQDPDLGSQDPDPDLGSQISQRQISGEEEPSHLDTSGEEVHSSSSEDEQEGHPPRLKLLTQEERVVEGLMGRAARPKVDVVETKETGRGVVARESIGKGRYVCEYKTSSVFSAANKTPDHQHALSGRGMYVMETAFEVEPGSGRLCFDATNRFHHPGRYINHVTRGANLKPMKPQLLRGKWRVGFLALRDIVEGEELCYDYGLRSEEVWTRKGKLEDGRVTCGKDRVGEEKAEVTVEGVIEVGGAEVKPKGRKGGRRSWWCPIVGCTSGPVQKITQHLLTKHHLAKKSKESLHLRRHKRAPPQEAINNHTPNPYARHRLGSSSKITEYTTPGPSRELPDYVPLETVVSCGRKGKKGEGRAVRGDGGKGERKGRAVRGDGGKGEGVFKTGGENGKGRAVRGDGGKGEGFFRRKGEEKGVGMSMKSGGATTRMRGESDGGNGEGGTGRGLELEVEEQVRELDGELFLLNFDDFLQSIVGGNRNHKAAAAVVSNVRKYLDHLDPGDMRPERLLKLSPVPQFVEGLREEGIGSSGVLQRLDAHALALRYLNFSTEQEGMPARVQRCRDFLKSFRKTFQAAKVAKEREGIEAKAYSPPDLSGVDRFLSDSVIREEFFSTADDILASDSVAKSQYNICLAIAAGRVLYSNAQRPAAVTGAQLSEYLEGLKAQKRGVDYTTVRVHAHKTGSSESAKLVLSRDIRKIMRVWEEVRDKVAVDSPFLFPSYKGEEISKLTRLVMNYAQEKGITLVKPQTLRTAVELKTKDLPTATQEAVTRSLSHSMATAQKHYRANSPKSGHLAFETIQGIVAGQTSMEQGEAPTEEPLTPTKRQRRWFTDEETEVIGRFFSVAIETKVAPRRQACEDFLRKHPTRLFEGRSASDIFSKVRNLYGRGRNPKKK